MAEKGHHTQIRMSEEAWNEVREKATAAGLTVPSYIRWSVHTAEISPTDARAAIRRLRTAEQRLEGLLARTEAGERAETGEIRKALEEVRTAEERTAGAFGR